MFLIYHLLSVVIVCLENAIRLFHQILPKEDNGRQLLGRKAHSSAHGPFGHKRLVEKAIYDKADGQVRMDTLGRVGVKPCQDVVQSESPFEESFPGELLGHVHSELEFGVDRMVCNRW
jgi:hypothetical protein